MLLDSIDSKKCYFFILTVAKNTNPPATPQKAAGRRVAAKGSVSWNTAAVALEGGKGRL